MLDSEIVKYALKNKDEFYKIIKFNKKTHLVSTGVIKYAQQYLIDNVFTMKAHPAAHGYVPKRSIVTNARKHVGKEVVLTLDLKNFFESITYDKLTKAFRKLKLKNPEYISEIVIYKNILPRGTSTAPVVSNLFYKEIDEKIRKLARSEHLMYTRYSDDMAFSGNYICKGFVENIKTILQPYGLSINNKKTKLMRSTDRQIVTNLIVNEKLNVSRSYVAKLKQELYKEGITQKTRGKLGFVKQINPKLYKNLRRKYA